MIRKLLILSLIWAVLILIVCAIPGGTLPERPLFNIPHFDKIVHMILYIPLAILVGGMCNLSERKWFRITGPLLTMMIIVFFGALIEFLQEFLFVNRSAELFDLLADVCGGLAGLVVYYLFLRTRFRRLQADHH